MEPLRSAGSRSLILFLAAAVFSAGFNVSPLYAAKKPPQEKPVPVRWLDPYEKLGITPVEPTPDEEEGILLRAFAPRGGTGTENWRKEVFTFSFVNNGVGYYDYATNDQQITYQPGTQQGSYIKTTRDFYKPSGESVEVIEEDEVGTVLRLIDAHMKMGGNEARIYNYRRSNFFPQSPATIGDMWEYDGSFEPQYPNPSKDYIIERSPFEFKATSELKGFAEIGGVRVAVIETQRTQSQREIHRKGKEQHTFDSAADITEWEFWDYANGTLMARYSIGDYKTIFEDGRLFVNQSQMFYYRI